MYQSKAEVSYQVKRTTKKDRLPKAFVGVSFETYDRAKYAVRRYLKSKGLGINLNENNFTIASA